MMIHVAQIRIQTTSRVASIRSDFTVPSWDYYRMGTRNELTKHTLTYGDTREHSNLEISRFDHKMTPQL